MSHDLSCELVYMLKLEYAVQISLSQADKNAVIDCCFLNKEVDEINCLVNEHHPGNIIFAVGSFETQSTVSKRPTPPQLT